MISKYFIFTVIWSTISQTCKVINKVEVLYPIHNEIVVLNLNEIFEGQDLDYQCPKCPLTLYNQLTLIAQTSSEIGENNSPLSFSLNGKYIAVLQGNTSFQVNIYIYQPLQAPELITKLFIYQQLSQIYCQNIVFQETDLIISDCYTSDELILYSIFRLFAIPFTYKISQIPTYSKLLSMHEHVLVGMFGNLNGSILIFKCNFGLPSQLIATIDQTLIPYLQPSDFTLQDNGSIFVSNSTSMIYTFNLINDKLILVNSYKLFGTDEIQIIGLSMTESQQYTKSSILFIVTNLIEYNILEFLINADYIQYGLYNGQQLQPNIGIKFQISEQYLIVIQQGFQQYFVRGQAAMTETEVQQFIQSILFTKNTTELVFLNPIDDTVLFINDMMTLDYLSPAQLIGQFNSSGVMLLEAVTKYKKNGSVCNTTINYTLIDQEDTQIYLTGSLEYLPNFAMYPRNLTYDLGAIVSGPLLQIQGNVSNSANYILERTLYTFNITLVDYPPPNISNCINVYNAQADTLLQLLVQNQVIYGYLCDNLYFVGFNCYHLFLWQAGTKPITNIQASFPNMHHHQLIFVYNQGLSTIIVNQAEIANKTSNVTQLGIISLEFEGIIYNYTSFTLIGDRLYVVIECLCQILIFDVFKLPYPHRIIDAMEFDIPFMPIQVVGDFNTYGQMLFINNQLNFLIIEYFEDKVVLLSSQDYLIQGTSQTSTINLVGNNLLITQINSTTQIIDQWEVSDLQQPIWKKQLPNMGTISGSILSDQLFLYVPITSGQLLIYLPAQMYHSSLYQTITLPKIFSAASSKVKSFVIFSEDNFVRNAILYPSPVIEFFPVFPYTNYSYAINYSLEIFNSIGSTPLSVSSYLTIYNSFLSISTISNGSVLALDRNGYGEFYFDPSEIFQGDILSYITSCLTCEGIDINVINYLQPGQSNISNFSYVQQMTNLYSQNATFILTMQSIYLLYQNYTSVLLYNLSTSNIEYCPVLNYDSIQSTLLVICQVFDEKAQNYHEAIIYLLQYNGSLTLLLQNHLNGIQEIQKAQYFLTDHLIIQGVQSQQTKKMQVMIFYFNETNQKLQTVAACPEKNTTSYEIIQLYNTPTSTYFSLFLTCFDSVNLYEYSGYFQDDNIILSEYYMIFNFDLAPVALQYSSLQQILCLEKSNESLTLLLTTNNAPTVIFNFTYQQNLTGSLVTYANPTFVTFIPPYGVFEQTNTISYSNGYLILSFTGSGIINYLSLITIYKLNLIQTPILMIGGYYIDLLGTYQLMPINGPNATILFTQKLDQHNLASLILQPQFGLQIQANQSFGEKNISLVAYNYYVQQSVTFTLSYPIIDDSGLPWWVWLIILLALVIGGMFLTIICYRCKQQEDDVEQDYDQFEL